MIAVEVMLLQLLLLAAEQHRLGGGGGDRLDEVALVSVLAVVSWRPKKKAWSCVVRVLLLLLSSSKST